jgi:hypothetical protein
MTKQFSSTTFLVIFLFCLMLGFFSCKEDNSTEPGDDITQVAGVVSNVNTGNGIVGAIIMNGQNILATTGQDGSYSFEYAAGSFNFTCKANGYKDETEDNVIVQDKQTTTVNFQLEPISVVEITDDITTNTTWENDSIYIIKNYSIDIDAILTIEAGTIIKLESGISIRVNGDYNGKILANGTDLDPIIFTSYRDDTHGGDTNGDGSLTTAAAGDWNYISISGTNNASMFDYCEFYYGGGADGYDYTLELDSETTTTVSNSIFSHNLGEEKGALNAYDAKAGTQITNNTFYDNIKPLCISGELDIDDSNVFHNPENAAEDNIKNGIFYDAPFGDIVGNRTWEETEVPFVIIDNTYDLEIETGTSLTLGDNVIVKFNTNRGIVYQGNNLINYDGSGVIFSSYKDDTRGGDTNGDGSITTPADNDWDGIENDNTSSYETWTNIYYDSH